MIITIPLYFFLYAYFFLVGLFLLFFFINIRHLFYTGSVTLVSFFITFITLAFAVITVYLTWHLLGGVDWQQGITVFDKSWLEINLFNL